MNYIGIDIGSTAAKVVVRGEKELAFTMPTGWSSKETALTIRENLKKDGIWRKARQKSWLRAMEELR